MVHPAHLPLSQTARTGQRFPASFRMSALWAALTVLLIGWAADSAFSQETEPPSDPAKIRQILLLLSDQTVRTQKELDALKQMPATKSVDERKETLIQQLDGLHRNFESIATKLQTEDLYLNPEEKFGWSRELEGLILPLLEAVSDLTAKPRRIERLKKRIAALEAQLKVFEVGQRNIQGLLEMEAPDLEPDSPQARQYRDTLEILQNKYNPGLVRVKFEEARRSLKNELLNSEPMWDTATRVIRDFFKNRGFNLLITAAVFFVLWYLLTKLRVFIVGEKSIIKIPPWIQKLMLTAYSALVLILCIMTSLVALYFLNDWLLLSVIILFLVAVFWASRQFIPRLFQEMRLALNLGTVRESERLIWEGVPWQIASLGLQATLVNPRLEGGQLQLPLGELIGKHSRPVVEGEPWFPTQIGNWVTLSDGTYGRVERQTLEQVVLHLKGDTLKFYATPEFLGKTPMNLSKGFRYDIEFGLDYSVQNRIVDDIPKLFEQGLRTHLERHFQKDSPDFTYTEISFDHAGSSALLLKVIVHVEGHCAERYEEIKREIQSTLVRICNENNLTIPFNQLTVTLPETLKPKSQP